MDERIVLKNVIRVLAVALEIMCFVPVFLVSCDGGKVTEVCMKTAITGHEEAGIEADMLYIWAFIIPVLIFGIWFFKERLQEIVIRVIVFVLAAIDIALWVSFKNEIVEIADNNYCQFETTSAYTVNYIFLGLVCLLSVLDACVVLYKQLSGVNDMDGKVSDLQSSQKNITNIAGNVVKSTMDAVVGTIRDQSEKGESINRSESMASQQQEMEIEVKSDRIQTIEYDGFCWQCGNKMKVGTRFCVQCGAQKE